MYYFQVKEQQNLQSQDDNGLTQPAISPIQAFKTEYHAAEAAERRKKRMMKKQESCQTQ